MLSLFFSLSYFVSGFTQNYVISAVARKPRHALAMNTEGLWRELKTEAIWDEVEKKEDNIVSAIYKAPSDSYLSLCNRNVYAMVSSAPWRQRDFCTWEKTQEKKENLCGARRLFCLSGKRDPQTLYKNTYKNEWG